MDGSVKQKRELNPGQHAKLISKITFFFVFPIFRRSTRKGFKDEDVYEIINEFGSKTLGDKLESNWDIERKKDKPNIFRTIYNEYKLEYLLWGLFMLIVSITLMIAKPTLIGKIVAYFNPNQKKITHQDVTTYAILLIGCIFASNIFIHTYSFMMQLLAMKIRIAATTLIYRKILKLSTYQVTDATGGQAVTLITKDIAVFEQVMLMVHQLFTGIAQIIVMAVMIYIEIGVSAFVGIALILLFMLLQGFFGHKTKKYRLATAHKTDERIHLTQEILSTIRIIKMYTLELFFSKSINTLRRKEIRNLQILTYLRTFCMALGMLSIKLAVYCCFVTFVALQNHITAEKAFVVIGCFNQLGVVLTSYIPLSFVKIAELKATLKRVNNYLLQDEVVNSQVIKHTEKQEMAVVMKEVAIDYRNRPIIKNINATLGQGVTMILGDVGCGKSSLLKAIVGDVIPSGTIQISGKVSYASQEPWIFPGTIRQNIVFNEKFNEARYQNVIKVCALQRDFDILSSGDHTFLSDKGLNLSQGQKIRINLARAVYKEADVYLLDDCLSAVDLKVGRQIFFECIKGFLGNKVCLLVCQLHTFLKHADQILIINKEGVKFHGTYSLLKELDTEELSERYSATDYDKENDESNTEESSSLVKKGASKSDTNIYAENKEQGAVKRDIYYKYLSAGGIILFLIVIILSVLRQVAETWSDFFIRFWVDSEQVMAKAEKQHSTNSTEYLEAQQSQNVIIYEYTLVIFAAAVLLFLTSFMFYIFAGRASINVHRQLVNKVLNAAMTFFDKNLAGNIINRFSRDLSILDELLPMPISECIKVTLSMGAILFVASSVNLWFIIPSVCFAVIMYFGRRLYVPAGRNIRRIEGSTRSPVIGHMQATFDGLATIKASEAQKEVQSEFEIHQDVYNSTQYMHIATLKAFSFYLDMLTALYTAIIIVAIPFFEDGIGAGSVGLVITQSLALTGLLRYGVLQWSELEIQMTSAERVLEYLSIKPENKSGSVIDEWPKKGKIIYKDVSLRYIDTLVLKNINFTIEAGEKIGVVGRTGAGKSSVVSALFRLYEFDGSIAIDDVDINTITAEGLRAKISIMPQNPVLFTGTIRSNLDPKSLYTDEQIWCALAKVEMKDKISSLDLATKDNATNFSIGQKQLLCLARIILQNNVILVFDEATANVDDKTDSLIHRIIQETFANSTMIVIAHRLHTVMNCDKILVMDAGMVCEYDHPKNLLNNTDSIFYSMVKGSGLLT